MAKNLTTLTRIHKNQLRREQPFIWLFGLQKTKGVDRYRFCSYPQIVHFGVDSAGDPLPWYPAPITHGGIEQDGEGGLPSIDVTLANVSLEIAPAVDQAGGFIGNAVEIHVVSALQLDNPDASISEVGEVVDCSMTDEAVTFSVSAFNLFQAQFPPFLFSKFNCRWLFGSKECAYNLNAPAATYKDCGLLTTDVRTATGFTLEACILVGADEDVNPNVAVVQHPKFAGFFPGLPRPGRR